jgi:hypothetical protein
LSLLARGAPEAAQDNEWRAERVQGDILTFCADCDENGTAAAVLTQHGWQPEPDDEEGAQAEDGIEGGGANAATNADG